MTDIQDEFKDIIETVFYEADEVRFTEVDECMEYIQEKTNECLKVYNEYLDDLLQKLYGLDR